MQLYDDPFELTNAVISALSGPEHPTMVSQVYSNDKNSATEVQAYAKIAGSNWTYFVKSLETTIGRNTDVTKPDEKLIDIDLGPAKVVSRKHATISYNLVTRVWELNVAGRNGAKIDTARIACGPNAPPAVLKSGSVMDIGGTQMMFILPDTAPQISPNVINMVAPRIPGLAEYLKKKPNFDGNYYNNINNLSNNFSQNQLTFSNTYQQPQQNNLKGFAMYNKPGSDTAAQYYATTTGPNGSMGNMNLLSTMKASLSGYSNMDTDLSREESKDIKPPYSYATMITQAILSNDEGVLSLSEIYDWIARNYAFYRYSKTGWQNSIRHNLSLNKAFEKVPRKPNEPGKGMKWQISESYKDEFLKGLANGSMSKVKRGSSVSRQLQLHLQMHNNLPLGAKEKSSLKSPNTNSQPSLNSSDQLYTTSSQDSQYHQKLPPLPTQQQSNNLPQQQQTHQHLSINVSQNANHPPSHNYGGGDSHALSYMAAAAAADFHPANTNPQHYPPLTSQQLQQQQLQQQQILHQIQQQHQQHQQSLQLQHPLPTSNNTINNNRNQVLGDKSINSSHNDRSGVQTPSPKLPNESTNSNKENSENSHNNSGSANGVNIDLMSFSSPNKGYTVSALEAYTPERGSRNLNGNKHKVSNKHEYDGFNRDDNNGRVKNGFEQPSSSKSSTANSNDSNEEQKKNDINKYASENNLQSSPAIWNFVQFGTPASQTPRVGGSNTNQDNQDDEDAKNIVNGSPIQQRRKALNHEAGNGSGAGGSSNSYERKLGDNELSDLKGVDLVKGFKK